MKVPPGEHERSLGVFPETCTEESCAFQFDAQQSRYIVLVYQFEYIVCAEVVGQVEQDTVVVGEYLKRVTEFFLPCRGECEGEGTVYPPAPQGMQNRLFSVRSIRCIPVVFHKQGMAAG